MPHKVHAIEFDEAVGPVRVTGRLDIVGPFYSLTDPEDPAVASGAEALADRIQQAIRAELVSFSRMAMATGPSADDVKSKQSQ